MSIRHTSMSTKREPRRGRPVAKGGKGSRGKAKRGRGRRASDDDDDDDDDEEEEEEEEEEDEYDVSIPARCELARATEILMGHPRAVRLCSGTSSSSSSSSSSSHFNLSLSAILSKLDNGRYRSVVAYVADIRAFLMSFRVKNKPGAGAGAASKSPKPSSAPTPAPVEELPSKRRRVPVLPSPVAAAAAGMKGDAKKEKKGEEPLPDANEDVEALLDFFNDRVAPRLSI